MGTAYKTLPDGQVSGVMLHAAALEIEGETRTVKKTKAHAAVRNMKKVYRTSSMRSRTAGDNHT